MDAPIKIPFYAKIALIFTSLFALVYTMQIGQKIIVPIAYAILIAILLNPFVNFLIRKKITKILAIIIAITLASVIFIGIIYTISIQLAKFSESYPQLKIKFNITSAEFLHWVSDKFNIRESKINAWIKVNQSEAINDFAIGEQLTNAGEMIANGMLLPVYLFMFLYYKPLLMDFIHNICRSENHTILAEVLTDTKKIIQTYLVGLFFEMLIIATMNSTGLLLLGIDYAILLGVIGAVLNLIPYLGGIIATALPMLVAFVTKESITYSVLVFFVYIFIQLIDNNYIIPKIVASRVKINGLISIIVVLIGGAVWGISGMALSIPLTAIVKVIFDHIEPLKPWGLLLGNIVPTVSKKIPFLE